MTGKLQFQFDFALSSNARRRDDQGHRILILGDFSGDNPAKPTLAERRPMHCDIDRFDTLLERLRPQLRLDLENGGGVQIIIEFGTLDDFHPDALYENLDLFRHLRSMRGRLENPSTYAAAAEELKRGRLGSSFESQSETTPTATPGETDLLKQLLGGPATLGQQTSKTHADTVQNLIQRLVGPYLDKSVDLGQQRQLISAIDDAITGMMREILHDSSFQALESCWRGASWLADRIEDDEDLPIFLLDVSLDNITQDIIAANGQAEQTELWKVLTESSLAIPGGKPWSLVIGPQQFGESEESLAILELLGAVSASCGGFFIAGASPKLLGIDRLAVTPDCSDWDKPKLAQAWQTLRHSPAARYIGLAFPRFMLRRPYGKKSDPTEHFQFEELPLRPHHEDYLWSNPALPCAELIARSWQEDEAKLQTIQDLPYHIYDDDDGQAMKPCAEVYLNEKTAQTILGLGLMPLLSIRNQNYAVLPRLQSIAEPPTGIN